MKTATITVFACHSRSCAPPPTGSGGSNDGGTSAGLTPRGGGGLTGRLPSDDDLDALTRKVRKPGSKWIGSDPALSEIYAAQGFHAKPKRLTRQEFNDMIEEDSDMVEMWRGINLRHSLSPADKREVGRALIDSDTHYSGLGVLGNGSYFASAPPGKGPTAARIEAGSYGDTLYRMAIDRNRMGNVTEVEAVAKIVFKATEFGLTKEYVGRADPQDLLDKLTNGGGGLRPRLHGMDITADHAGAALELMRSHNRTTTASYVGGGRAAYEHPWADAGRVGAVMGFDAVSTGQSKGGYLGLETDYEYTVVYNRGALTADTNVYHDDGIRVKYTPD